MKEEALEKRIAQLEFEQDQLLSELQYVDTLLRKVGFSEGLETVKWAAKDIIGENFEV